MHPFARECGCSKWRDRIPPNPGQLRLTAKRETCSVLCKSASPTPPSSGCLWITSTFPARNLRPFRRAAPEYFAQRGIFTPKVEDTQAINDVATEIFLGEFANKDTHVRTYFSSDKAILMGTETPAVGVPVETLHETIGNERSSFSSPSPRHQHGHHSLAQSQLGHWLDQRHPAHHPRSHRQSHHLPRLSPKARFLGTLCPLPE